MIKEIISELISTRNIFKLIELSKKYTEINLEDYFRYVPSININYTWFEPEKDNKIGLKSYSINQISSFKLKGLKKTFYSKEYFLQNILDVIEITINGWVFKVKDGTYYAYHSENFFSIEFSLSCLNGYALVKKNDKEKKYYCIEERLLNEKLYQKILRIVKLNEINNNKYQSPKELVQIEEKRLRDKYIDSKKKKIKKKTT